MTGVEGDSGSPTIDNASESAVSLHKVNIVKQIRKLIGILVKSEVKHA